MLWCTSQSYQKETIYIFRPLIFSGELLRVVTVSFRECNVYRNREAFFAACYNFRPGPCRIVDGQTLHTKRDAWNTTKVNAIDTLLYQMDQDSVHQQQHVLQSWKVKNLPLFLQSKPHHPNAHTPLNGGCWFPSIDGRWFIIPQLAVYTTYIPLIYCLLGGYMLPTTY